MQALKLLSVVALSSCGHRECSGAVLRFALLARSRCSLLPHSAGLPVSLGDEPGAWHQLRCRGWTSNGAAGPPSE
eukprot:672051-Pelagomonas_calceolata.AAC.3